MKTDAMSGDSSSSSATATVDSGGHPFGMTLAATSRRIGRQYAAALAGQSVTPPQLAVLRQLLREDGLPLHEIGRRASLDPTSLTWLADQLEKGGLAERRRPGDDRRVIRLFVTQRGRSVGETLMERIESVDRQIRQLIAERHGPHAQEAFEAIIQTLLTEPTNASVGSNAASADV